MSTSRLNFQLERVAPGSRARAARFRTLHNDVLTPIFMPVGTQATVKSQTVETLEECGAQILLANTYHLLLRPGPEVFRRLGGIHRFMNWKRSVLTDSGGYQIFSLPHSRRMTEEGAEFQSYVDGARHLLSPELSIGMQRAIGSDIMMALDQCIPSTSDHAAARVAMDLTHRWAKRSLAARDADGGSPQSLFAIVQGACFEDLRRASAEQLAALPFDGFAIGGLAVGETKREREDFTEFTAALLPEHLPRYLMGVGTPIDLLEAVHRGVDMFDCILPSALAQRGRVYTWQGSLQLRRSIYKFSEEPIDARCPCPVCATYTRAYLHHLVKCEEILGWHLIARHNLHFYQYLMGEMRARILDGTFAAFYREKREWLARADGDEFPEKRTEALRKPVTDPRVLGSFEVHVSPAGFASIKDATSGEIMHSVNDPEQEARELYVEQSRLGEALARGHADETRELVIWDVGLGAATNAMAAVRAWEAAQALAPGEAPAESGAPRSLRIVSFENQLDSLKLALKHRGLFKHLRHAAPVALLKDGHWETATSAGARLHWELRHGDFLAELENAPAPDLIFYDPFSYKTDRELWSPACFARLFARCAGRPVQLFSYSASTAVRAALLHAGFHVARGRPSGPKQETTIAYTAEAMGTHRHLLESRLSAAWLERWERSEAKIPASVPEELHPEFSARIRRHPQFTSG